MQVQSYTRACPVCKAGVEVDKVRCLALAPHAWQRVACSCSRLLLQAASEECTPAPIKHTGVVLCRSSPFTAEAGTSIPGRRRSKSSQCHQGQLGSAPLQFRLVQQAATSRECCQRCLASSLGQVGVCRVKSMSEQHVRAACQRLHCKSPHSSLHCLSGSSDLRGRTHLSLLPAATFPCI
jgi:hypothetical protein